jgi:hypothetical protein
MRMNGGASSLAALNPDVFVGLVQAFRKLPALAALAPTQTEMPSGTV